MRRGRPRGPVSRNGEGRIDLKNGKWYATSPRIGNQPQERLCRGQDFRSQAEKILKDWLEEHKEELQNALSKASERKATARFSR
jgi:hypothetical protein